MIQLDRRAWRTNLFWSVLLCDALYQYLNFGGLAASDFAVHAGFLVLATFLAFGEKSSYPVPKQVTWLIILVMGTGLIQLIPLPHFLFSFLAPIKVYFAGAIAAVFPDTAVQTQIAVLPSYHGLLLAKLGCDFYLVLLVFVGPRPRRQVFRIWFRLITFILSVLMIMAGRGLISDGSWLSPYQTTFGGLVNTNHFALTSVILILLCIQSLTLGLRQMVKEWKSAAGHRSNVLISFLNPLLDLILLDLCFLAFRFANSRSGILLLVIAIVLFFAQIAMSSARNKSSWTAYKFAFAGVMLSVLILSQIPLGSNLDKFDRNRFDWGNRVEAMKVGVNFLKRAPIMGTGLGSTYVLLPPSMSSAPDGGADWTEYHNDYIQISNELGIPGIIAIGLLLVILWTCLGSGSQHADRRYYVMAARAIVAVVLIHSLISFPIRVPAIRILTILVVGAAIRFNQNSSRRKVFSKPLLVSLPGFVICSFVLVNVATTTMPADIIASDQKHAWKYGRRFEIPLMKANQLVDKALLVSTDVEDARHAIDQAELICSDYILRNTFSVYAMTTTLMVHVLRSKMVDTPEALSVLGHEVNAIGLVSHPDNIQYLLAKMFFYGVYEDQLSESQLNELNRIRQVFAARMDRKKQALDY